MLRVLLGLAGAALVALMLAEFFVTFLLPRRVKRDPRIARRLYASAWRPWRWLARRLPAAGEDTMLGFYGPLGLALVVGTWTLGLILGFAALHWANDTRFAGALHGIGRDLYMSAGTFFSASTGLAPRGAFAHVLNIAEAAAGFAVLFIVIGYLPALYQAFSRREVALSQLDPRGGSPPTAAGLALYAARHAGWPALDAFLREWETWAAELMETHLAYPVLGYFRSQHVNQSWLRALTAVLDASALMLSCAEGGPWEGAELAFAVGRHAVADLSYTYRADGDSPRHEQERLPAADLERLSGLLSDAGLALRAPAVSRRRLDELRALYEPQATALAEALALPVARWLPEPEAMPNWQATRGHSGTHVG